MSEYYDDTCIAPYEAGGFELGYCPYQIHGTIIRCNAPCGRMDCPPIEMEESE